MTLDEDYNSIRNEIVGDSFSRYYFDDTIYHYTSPDGLEGILLKKGYPTFRFSRFDCLNDKSEGNEIIQLYHQAIVRESSNPNISKEYLDLISDILPTENVFFSIDINSSGEEKLPTTYVWSSLAETYLCSFSKAPDDLAMWNYYVKGTRYEGFNIGVCPELMIESLSPNSYHKGFKFKLIEVIYNSDIKASIIKRLIERPYVLYESSSKSEAEKEALRSFIADYLGTLRFYFKSEYFKHEQEVRAIIMLPKEELVEADNSVRPIIEYRFCNGLTIPYISIEFEHLQSMIESVTIGPVDLDSVQRKEQCIIMRDRLATSYSHVTVNYSGAPVRY